MQATVDTVCTKSKPVLFILMTIWGIFFCTLNVPAYFGVALYSQQYIGGFLILALAASFISIPWKKGAKMNLVDLILALTSLPAGGYILFYYPTMAMNLNRPTTGRIICGIICVLLLIECIRRMMGFSLCAIVVTFLFYARFSSSMTGIFRGRVLSTSSLINYIYVDSNSLLWMLGTATTLGVAFIVFGQVLLSFGGGKTLIDIALIICGRFRGAGAKAAVISSGLVGTITGAPVANVLLTGSVTIPMMKGMGYPPEKAAAVEAVASSGGQIMPPVMGIAAFIIAETLGVPYSEVAIAAIIPALLFYIVLFWLLDLDAGKMGMKGLDIGQLPAKTPTIKSFLVIVPGLALLLGGMFSLGLPPAFCAVISGFLSLFCYSFIRDGRKDYLKKVYDVLLESGGLCVNIGIILSAAGLVVGAINASGIAFNVGLALTRLAQGNIFPLLIMAAITSIILGMGMPSVAAYALVAVLVVPSLVTGGVLPMAAHLFVFYFAVVSNITPPVAVACFAAAPLAGSKLWTTGYEAVRIAIPMYITPLLFIYLPGLILEGTTFEVVSSAFFSLSGMMVSCLGYIGFLKKIIPWARRVVYLVAGGIIVLPITSTLVNSVALIIAVMLLVVTDAGFFKKTSKVAS